jgi:uncharacterized SAM-binding protein YcdF (DUF218 family)
MHTLLSSLIMPLPIFWLLVILAAVFSGKGRKKSSRKLLGLSLLWLAMISTPFIPDLVVQSLENRYPVLVADGNDPVQLFKNEDLPGNIAAPASDVHILVLGGGHTYDDRLPANNQLSLQALARLAEGVRLHRQIEGSTLITSGWAGKRETISQAEVLAKAALLLGVDSSRIKM